jgi:hypothetical protein
VTLDIREGWSAFAASPGTEIALHRRRARRPRIELSVKGDLGERHARRARLAERRTVRGREVCMGKDRDGNSIQLSADPPD